MHLPGLIAGAISLLLLPLAPQFRSVFARPEDIEGARFYQ
jgi:hypothetical protein